MVAEGLIGDDGQADMHTARYEGQVAVGMGASLPVAYAAWVRSRHPSRLADDMAWGDAPAAVANRAAFARELAARASGAASTPIDFGDQGRLAVVKNAMPPRYDPRGLDYDFDRFAEAAGRTMFADAWATRMEENGESLSGLDVLEAAPATPREAVLEGATVAGRYEALSGLGIGALYHKALEAHFGPDHAVDDLSDDPRHGMDHFASDLACQALGMGVRWDDDHEPFDCPDVGHCYVSEAGLPDQAGPTP